LTQLMHVDVLVSRLPVSSCACWKVAEYEV
jgi:hypothetical protein